MFRSYDALAVAEDAEESIACHAFAGSDVHNPLFLVGTVSFVLSISPKRLEYR